MQKKALTIASAALLFSTNGAAAQEAQPVPKQPINLVDVATVSFNPALERYDDWESWQGSWNGDFLVLVDQQGQPTYCEPLDLNRMSELSNRLCADIIANARLNILEGYSLGGREGLVALSKQPMTVIPGLGPAREEGASPFSFGLAELAPDVFTDFEPATEAESVVTPGMVSRATEVTPEYPSYSLRARHEGSTGTVLEVGADGSVVSCRPVETSGFARLDNAACIYALEHISFQFNQGGSSAAPHYYKLRMTWRLPEE